MGRPGRPMPIIRRRKSGRSRLNRSTFLVFLIVRVWGNETVLFGSLLCGFFGGNFGFQSLICRHTVVLEVHGSNRKSKNRATAAAAAFYFRPELFVMCCRLSIRAAFSNAFKYLLQLPRPGDNDANLNSPHFE